MIYITSSPFSGSTLLTFLLNTHPSIATVGHTTAFAGMRPDFPCSCGKPVKDCPLFEVLRAGFAKHGWDFSFFGDFPTDYRVLKSRRLNQLVVQNLPRLASSAAENLRDDLVGRIPPLRRRLARADEANRIFLDICLRYFNADVYVDNSHCPYRLKRLQSLPDFSVQPVHLVRNIYGVALSAHETYGWDPAFAAVKWVRKQEEILRLTKVAEADRHARHGRRAPFLIDYDAVCADPTVELASLFEAAGLVPVSVPTDFDGIEHHILGNRSRLGTRQIRVSERWRRDLGPADQKRVAQACRHAVAASRQATALSSIVEPMLKSSDAIT